MSNNSLALTSTLVKKSIKVVNISVSPICTKPSQRTSFFLNACVFIFSTKISVQNPGIKLIQMAKYIRQIPKLTLTLHAKEILLIESSFLLKTVLFLH